jgi:hypothetical protein
MIDIEILIELGLLQLFATEILLLLLVLFMVFVRRKFKILIKLSVRRLQNLLAAIYSIYTFIFIWLVKEGYTRMNTYLGKDPHIYMRNDDVFYPTIIIQTLIFLLAFGIYIFLSNQRQSS